MTPRPERRQSRGLAPGVEPCEGRLLLAASALVRAATAPALADLSPGQIRALQFHRPAYHPIRPNLPVTPYARVAATGSFYDPTVAFVDGKRIQTGTKNYIAPYAVLDARNGFIKVGSATSIQDHATILANPAGRKGTPGILIGNSVYIGAGAIVRGPAVVGALPKTAPPPTSIGAKAVIDGATVQPGAIVSELAYVGPNVTVPGNVVVLPGKTVLTDAEASDPALGKVAIQTGAERVAAAAVLTNARALARGYITLYQGNPATGVSPGTAPTQPSVSNGSLAPVSGVGPEPGSASVSFEPATAFSPSFLVTSPTRLAQATYPQFGSRLVGQITFQIPFEAMAAKLGGRNSIRADEAQPFNFAAAIKTGANVVINGPVGGTLSVGKNLLVADNAVILAGKGSTIGDDVTIGANAVITGSSLGSGVLVGDGALVSNSTLPAGTVIPAGSIVVAGKIVGQVEPRR